MKELTREEIKEAVKNFSSSWMNIAEGENVKFTILSRTLYNVPAGEDGLDGSTSEFDRWQCKIEDESGVVRVLKVQQRLGMGMLNAIENKELSWEEHLKGSTWYVKRIDQWNWKIDLLDWKGRNGKETEQRDELPEESKSKSVKIPTKEKTKSDKPLKLSKSATVANNLIENNELDKKEFTYDALQTVVSTLTDLSTDESEEAIQELITKKVIRIKNDKVVWL